MWKLTPSTPTAAKLNMRVQRPQRRGERVQTPFAPWQEAEFISATRNGRSWRWATAMNGAIGVARPAEELSASRLGIDGKPGLVGSVTQARSG